MKAPTDKTNDTVQILVTRRCDLYFCSNCTQILPFRKDPLDMSPDVFRKALRSLRGWPGIRGIFGGNPCMHPKFEELMQILVEEVPDQAQRGIWTNNLRQHGQLVRDVFYPRGRFNLNAHADSEAAAEIDKWLPGRLIPTSRNRLSWHSPILLAWQDLGMTEEQWIAARETCDINTHWSAAIMERDGEAYVYFCEVAGSLDGVRNQNNGILAEDGWWRWKMDRFQSQVRSCCDKGCGVPIRALGHKDREDTYDYTDTWSEVVEPVAEKRAKRLSVKKHETLPELTDRATDYQALQTKKPIV